MMLTHIDIDIEDEQEASRVLALLDHEQIPYRVERRPMIMVEQQAGVNSLPPDNQ